MQPPENEPVLPPKLAVHKLIHILITQDNLRLNISKVNINGEHGVNIYAENISTLGYRPQPSVFLNANELEELIGSLSGLLDQVIESNVRDTDLDEVSGITESPSDIKGRFA